MRPPPHLCREDLRAIDRLAEEEFGLPSCVLMENAGRGAAECILRCLAERRALGRSAERVAIVCGSGNNGGDGWVVARHLANAGVALDVFATVALEDLAGDAALMRRVVERMRLPISSVATELELERARERLRSADVIVDALLGTGFRGELRAREARLIAGIDELRRLSSRAPLVVALDLPSGLDADSGEPARTTVAADWTVTFAAPKTGFRSPAARPYLGRVEVVSIGVPDQLIERFRRE